MSVWKTYSRRLESKGKTIRDSVLNREKSTLRNKLPDNLSYEDIIIDGRKQCVAVINSDDLNKKYLHSLPDEDISHGGLIFYEDNFWIVTEKDARKELYVTAKMERCNHLLKWITADGIIHEQWSIVEDGTNYLTGELEDHNFIATRGDTRIALTVPRTGFTAEFSRQNRFLIDDEASIIKLAYQLTKPFKLTNVFNGDGVFKFILQEVASTEDDNHLLGIADYYKYFPHDDFSDVLISEATSLVEEDAKVKDTNVGKKVWI